MRGPVAAEKSTERGVAENLHNVLNDCRLDSAPAREPWLRGRDIARRENRLYIKDRRLRRFEFTKAPMTLLQCSFALP
jgi:hypothetical protein